MIRFSDRYFLKKDVRFDCKSDQWIHICINMNEHFAASRTCFLCILVTRGLMPWISLAARFVPPSLLHPSGSSDNQLALACPACAYHCASQPRPQPCELDRHATISLPGHIRGLPLPPIRPGWRKCIGSYADIPILGSIHDRYHPYSTIRNNVTGIVINNERRDTPICRRNHSETMQFPSA